MKPLPGAMTRNDSMLATVATGLTVIALCSIPSATSFVLQLSKKEKKTNEIYEDRDGKATAESMKAFSARVPKALILLFASVGTGLSVALGILSTSDEKLALENWLSVGAWVLFTSIVSTDDH